MDLFVDPFFGNDFCPGTKESPKKTLTRALSVIESGQTIHLHGGAYTYNSQHGEDFSTPVPAGVTIAADLSGDAVLLGQGAAKGLAFLGSGAASHLTIQGFTEGITAKTGEQILSAVKLVGNARGIHLQGDAHSSATDISIAEGQVGIELDNGASLEVSGGDFGHLGGDCVLGSKAFGLYNASSLTFDAVSVHDSCGAIELHNAASATFTGSTITNVGPEHTGLGSSIEIGEAASLKLVDTAISDGHGPAIYAFSAGSLVSITGGTIHAGGSYGLSLGVASATIEGTELTGNGMSCGIHLDFGALSLHKVKMHGFQAGLHQAGGMAKVRESVFSGGAYGVLFLGGSLDLGTLADPGKNNLQGSSDTALYVGSSENVNVSAVSNGWLPNVQGASYLGVFSNHGTIVGPLGENAPTPRNFVLTGQGPKVTY
jgi:hypothetical protein